MTFKIKALVASLALATAGSAFADITTPDELFLNVYDATAGVTFVKDLGVLGANLVNGSVAGQTWNFGSDANWLSFATQATSGAAGWIYNVVSVNGTGTVGDKYVSTYAGAQGALNSTNSPTNSATKQFNLVKSYINAVAPAMVGGTFEHVTAGSQDFQNFGFGFQSNWLGKANFSSTSAAGTNLYFGQLTVGSSNLSHSAVLQGPTGEYFNLDASSGALSLVAAPVPEPSEWALMLAGLMCVGAIARRRTTA